ncbi:MAG TPA: type II toxin-antitoxin system RelE/ParE family toxin [Candidatus Binataceae bacterium]|nr:type II toxin-antitoxin system RelE/ParE family toxin [Candidatus Binataceae bacterium]
MTHRKLQSCVIVTFRHKGLRDLFHTGRSAKVPSHLRERCADMLDILDEAMTLQEINIPGFDFHPLLQFKPVRYSIHVNGPWCITFEWVAPNVFRVDLEQYH